MSLRGASKACGTTTSCAFAWSATSARCRRSGMPRSRATPFPNPRRADPPPASVGSGCCFGHRPIAAHDRSRAVAGLALEDDLAAVLLDDLLDGRQAQSGAEILGAEERLEAAGEDRGRDSWAGVLDRHFEPAASLSRADRDSLLRAGGIGVDER